MSTSTRKRKNASAMRMVGALLALHREAAGYTQRSLGEVFGISEQQIASVEQGRRPLKLDLAEEFDDFLDTKGALATSVKRMPEEFLDQEAEAIAISSYENQVLPGLLQTAAYAEAVFRSRVPVYDDDKVAQLVAARVERQAILRRREPPITSFVIREPVLRAPIGGHGVWVEQLRHLLECPASCSAVPARRAQRAVRATGNP